MIPLAFIKPMRPLNVSRKVCSNWSGAGWLLWSSARTFHRLFRRIHFFCELIECVLVLVKIGRADFEQTVERGIYHLVVQKFFGEGGGADAEVTFRFREHVGLKPLLIALKLGDHGGVRLREVGFYGRIGSSGEGQRYIMLEERNNVRQLLDRNFGVDVGWILQICAGGDENGRHLLFAGHDGGKPRVRRGEFAAHDSEDAFRNTAGVGVWIFLPGADGFESKERAANVGEHEFAVGFLAGRKRSCVESYDAVFHGVQRGDLVQHAGVGIVFELRVVLVETGGGAERRGKLEVDACQRNRRRGRTRRRSRNFVAAGRRWRGSDV